jgi:eukaryotic-like serine/threonine-protein kinase
VAKPQESYSAVAAGQLVSHYRVTEKLGEGGMGVVWKAHDEQLGRFVALKLLPADKLADTVRRSRFLQEAQSASALNHPNIVTIYDLVRHGGIEFLVMEAIDGATLEQSIPKSGMRLRDALPVAIQVANALSAAHAAGIVHRDLKPGNVMVTAAGQVKVLDFGLAKLTEGAPVTVDDSTQTQHLKTDEGVVVGTAAYMSPEQAQGLKVDGRSDIFSFGALLYEMVSGRRAFSGDTRMSTMAAVLERDPPPLRDVAPMHPRQLERLIAHCLQKNPAHRIQSMSDVAIALGDLHEEASSSSGSAIVPASASSRYRSRRLWMAGAGAIAVVAAIGVSMRPGPAQNPIAATPVIRPLTFDAGISTDPTLSPDGKLLAYASDRAGNGNFDIYIQQVAGGPATRVTTDAANETSPSFSFDGTRIAFHSSRGGGGIYVIPALGGEPRLVAPHGQDPRFSPKENAIVYWVGPNGWALTSQAFLIKSPGSPPQRLFPQFVSIRRPIWSPDGANVLFEGAKELKTPVRYLAWIAPVAGGEPVSVGDAIRDARAISAWLASGKLLQTLGPTIVTRDVSANPWRMAAPVPVTFGSAVEGKAQGSSDRIVFTSSLRNRDIYRFAGDTEKGQFGAPTRLTFDWTFDSSPKSDAAGKTLVYVSSSNLRYRDLATGRERVLDERALDPLLSADGTEVLYRWVPPDVRNVEQIAWRVHSLANGLSREVCASCPRARSWSASKRYVLSHLAGDGGRTVTTVRDLESGREVEMLPGEDAGPTFLSPDEKWVVLMERGSLSGRRIWAAPFLGMQPIPRSSWIPITAGDQVDREPQWSPSGSSIYFNSMRDGFFCIWVQRLDPVTKRPKGEPFPAIHLHDPRLTYPDPDTGTLGLALTRDSVFLSLTESSERIWLREPAKTQLPPN